MPALCSWASTLFLPRKQIQNGKQLKSLVQNWSSNHVIYLTLFKFMLR